jgi:alpha-1,3/alpha-1,6-mannosyltransferase
LAGGYDARLEDNMMTLVSLIDRAKSCSLTYNIVTPSTSQTRIAPFNCTPVKPDVLFLLNFTTIQRSALLHSSLALLYTPTNEHFGIGPVEGMLCGLPVVACDSGGPTESILCDPVEERTGWLCAPEPDAWVEALSEILVLTPSDREALAERSRKRAREMFGMHAMAKGIEGALRETGDKGPVNVGLPWLWMFFVVCVSVAYVLRNR